MPLIELLRLIKETMEQNHHQADENVLDYGVVRAWSDAHSEIWKALDSCSCSSGLQLVADLHIPVIPA